MSDQTPETPAAGPLEPPKVKRRPGSPTGNAHGVPLSFRAPDPGDHPEDTDPEPTPADPADPVPTPAEPVPMPTVPAPDVGAEAERAVVDSPGAGVDAERIARPIETVEPVVATPRGLQEVVSIARRATAHNFGETVWEANIAPDETGYWVRMSSWPRANEARDGLRSAGYEADHMPPDGGHPRVYVKASEPTEPLPEAEPHRITVRVPAARNWLFSADALAGLVGQEVRILSDAAKGNPIGRARIVEAHEGEGGVLVTLDVTQQQPGLVIRDELSASVGLSIPPVEGTPPPDVSIGFQPQTFRRVEVYDSVTAFEIAPATPPLRTHGQEYDGDPEKGGQPR